MSTKKYSGHASATKRGNWGDRAIIEYDKTPKYVSCATCKFYGEDKSCSKRNAYIPEAGYDSWKSCSDFYLADKYRKEPFISSVCRVKGDEYFTLEKQKMALSSLKLSEKSIWNKFDFSKAITVTDITIAIFIFCLIRRFDPLVLYEQILLKIQSQPQFNKKEKIIGNVNEVYKEFVSIAADLLMCNVEDILNISNKTIQTMINGIKCYINNSQYNYDSQEGFTVHEFEYKFQNRKEFTVYSLYSRKIVKTNGIDRYEISLLRTKPSFESQYCIYDFLDFRHEYVLYSEKNGALAVFIDELIKNRSK